MDAAVCQQQHLPAVVTSTHYAALGQLDDFYDSLMDFEMDDIENQPGNNIDGKLCVPGEEDKCDELDTDNEADADKQSDEADLDGEDDPDEEKDSPVVAKRTKESNKKNVPPKTTVRKKAVNERVKIAVQKRVSIQRFQLYHALPNDRLCCCTRTRGITSEQ